MIAGLPVGTWVLMVLSVVPGVVLVVMAYRAHRSDIGDAVGRAGDAAGVTRGPEPRREAGHDANGRQPPRNSDNA